MYTWCIVCAFTVVIFLINFISVFWACKAPAYLFVLGSFVFTDDQVVIEGADGFQKHACLSEC